MIASRSLTTVHPQPTWLWQRFVVLLVSVLLLQPVWMAATQPLAGTFSMPDLAALPLSFVPNKGQFAAPVQAEVRTSEATVAFAATEVTFALPDTTLRLQFQGANAATTIAGTQPLPGKVNYLHGNNPQQWRTNVPTYASLMYAQLYPGIDLRYDSQHGNLKGTYTVAPGVDPVGCGKYV